MLQSYTVEKLLRDPEYRRSLGDHVRNAFRREHIGYTAEDFEDACSELRHVLLFPGELEHWEDRDQHAKAKLARAAVRRAVGNRRLRESRLHPSADVADGKFDPLGSQELQLWALAADCEYRSIESPPYKVAFIRDEVEYEKYRNLYDFVPPFDIVPVDEIGWARSP